MTAEDVIVKFGADMSGLSKGFQDVEKQGEGLGKSLESKFEGLGKTFQKVGVGLTVGVTAPLVAIGALALKSSADVGGAFKNITLQTGLTGAALESMKGSFKAVFSSVNVDAKDASDEIVILHSKLGIIGPELDKIAIKTANLAKLTGASLPQLATDLGDLANQFKLTADQASNAEDTIYKIAQATGNAAEPAFSQYIGTIKQFAPQANLMNWSLEATSYVVGKLTQQGAPVDAFFNGMTKAMKVGAAEGKSADVVFQGWIDTIQKSKDPMKTAGDLMGKDGLGKNAAQFVAAITTGKISWSDYLDLLKSSPEVINKTMEENRSLADTFGVFKNKIEIAMQPLGTAINKTFMGMTPLLDKVAGGVQGLGDTFAKLPAPVQQGIVLVGMFAAQLGPFLATLGSAMPVFVQLGGAFKGAGGAVAGFGSKLVGIPVALASIVAGAPKDLYTHFKSAETAAGGLLTRLRDVGSTLKGLVGSAGGLVGKIAGVGGALPAIASSGVSIPRMATAGISMPKMPSMPNLGPFTTGLEKAHGLFGSIAGKITGLSGPLSTVTGKVSSVASSAGGIVGKFTGMLGPLAGAIPAIAPLAAGVAVIGGGLLLAGATSKTFRDTLGSLVPVAQNLATHLSGGFSKLMSGDIGGAMNELKVGLTEAFDALKKIDWGTIVPKILGEMQKGAQQGLATLQNMIQSVNWADLANQLKNAIGSAFTAIKNVDWGGIAAGLMDALAGALDTLMNMDWSGMTDAAIKAIGDALNALFGVGGETEKGMGDSLSKGAAKAGPDILGKLLNVFAKLLSTLPTIFIKIAGSLADHLAKTDWGKLGGMLLTAIGNALVGLGALLINLDWGALGAALWNAVKSWFNPKFLSLLVDQLASIGQKIWTLISTALMGFGVWYINQVSTIGTQIWGWISGALIGFGTWYIAQVSTIGTQIWGWISGALIGFGTWLINQLLTIGTQTWSWIVAALSGFGTWFINLASAIGSTIWGWISGAVGQFGSWLGGLVSGIGSTIWSLISSAVGQFGSWLGGLVTGIGGSIWNSISSACGQFGSWLGGLTSGIGTTVSGYLQGAVNTVRGGFQSLGTAIVDSFKGGWNSLVAGRGAFEVNIVGHKVGWGGLPSLAKGGIMDPQAGGVPIIVAEAGRREAIVPEELFGGIAPWVFDKLPRFGTGGIVGGGSQTSGATANYLDLEYLLRRDSPEWANTLAQELEQVIKYEQAAGASNEVIQRDTAIVKAMYAAHNQQTAQQIQQQASQASLRTSQLAQNASSQIARLVAQGASLTAITDVIQQIYSSIKTTAAAAAVSNAIRAAAPSLFEVPYGGTPSQAQTYASSLKKNVPASIIEPLTGGVWSNPNSYGEYQTYKPPKAGLGGIFRTPVNRIVGDVPEVVIPLAKLPKIIGGLDTSAAGPTYNSYVTVDSEELTRKVLRAHRELEDYNHL